MTTATLPPGPETIERVRHALAAARGGDLAGAVAIVDDALARGRDTSVLHALAGTLACQAGDLTGGIAHLEQALDAMPDDLSTRANLAQALIQAGRGDEAWAYVAPDHAARDPDARLWRLRAHLQQVRGDAIGAAASYARVIDLVPGDFESWNNLGNVRTELGDKHGARTALDHAVALRPDLISVRLNHAAAVAESAGEIEAVTFYESCVRDFPDAPQPLGELGSLLTCLQRDGEALAMLTRAVALAPGDAMLAVRLGESCLGTFDNVRAETEFRRALALDPVHAAAHLQLAILYERSNRVSDLAELVNSAEAIGVEKSALDFLRALQLRRERRFAQALSSALAVPETIEPGRRSLLIGQCHDRLGDTERAFAAFTEMNRLNARDPTDPCARAAGFRDRLRRSIDAVTPAWYRGWSAVPPAPRDMPAPVFLVGFPRSGTTLLDTLLMGHPEIDVMEELPPLRIVEEMIGDLDRLAASDGSTLAAARSRYFEEVRAQSDWRPGRTLVDKLPMNLNKVPLIHRLFPDARFILALRHPCDAVLSCYSATFRLNNAMANFLDLGTTVETYDLSFRHWQQCRDLLPIRVQTVRYEDVVADREAVLRPVIDYLGLDWHDGALDHERTAAARSLISTPSYSQVIEPIYSRSVGRWERYRNHLAPVLPVLAPWVERFGYAM